MVTTSKVVGMLPKRIHDFCIMYQKSDLREARKKQFKDWRPDLSQPCYEGMYVINETMMVWHLELALGCWQRNFMHDPSKDYLKHRYLPEPHAVVFLPLSISLSLSFSLFLPLHRPTLFLLNLQ